LHESTTTDNGYRSKCCYAPIRLGFKLIKKTNVRMKIWICTKCTKRDVDIVEYNKLKNPMSTWSPFAPDVVDTEEPPVVE
jgi:hypothetical protein